MGCVFVRIKSLDDDGENTKTVVTENTELPGHSEKWDVMLKTILEPIFNLREMRKFFLMAFIAVLSLVISTVKAYPLTLTKMAK